MPRPLLLTEVIVVRLMPGKRAEIDAALKSGETSQDLVREAIDTILAVRADVPGVGREGQGGQGVG